MPKGVFVNRWDPEKIKKVLAEVSTGKFFVVEVLEKYGLRLQNINFWRNSKRDFDIEWQHAIDKNYTHRLRQIEEWASETKDDITSDGKPNMAAVRRSEVKIGAQQRILAALSPRRYSERNVGSFLFIPELLIEDLTVQDKIKILNRLVAEAKVCPEDGEKMVKMFETQIKIEDMQKLVERVAELEKLLNTKN